MSGNRRKPPQGRGRRAAQPPPSPGRRAASRGGGQAPPSAPGPDGHGRRDARGHRSEPGAPGAPGHGGRAEARRAAQGGRRRAAAAASAQGGRRGRGRGRGVPERKRFIDYPRAGKHGVRRWLPSWKLVTGLCFGFFALLMGALGIGLLLVDVPNDKVAAAQVQKNVYYWNDGSQMVVAGGGDQNRQIVGINEIPKHMRWAVIAAENETFYQDSGVDPMGIARAVVKMAMGGETQSGSTITQQYVKNTYLDQSQTLSRKARELLISIKVGGKLSKDEILAGYLNTGYYGRGAYGIQAAAQAYYHKDAKELSASESAFLSATLNGPNLYDPEGGVGAAATREKNLKRAKARWSWTLDREVATGHMSKATRAKIGEDFPMPDKPSKSTELKGQIGYLVELADNNVISSTKDSANPITKTALDRGGYRIHTTFDKKKIQKLQKTVEAVKKKNIDPKKRDVDKYVQFGGASVRPEDGAIQAIYGGEDATEHFRNNADYTGVQVGSTFKPFVMAAAMRDGVRDPKGPEEQGPEQRTKVSPKSVYNGNNKIKLRNYNGTVWHDKDGGEWHQKNDGNKSYGMINLRTAMQYSVNTPFIQLGWDIGTEKVKQAALDAGVNEESLARTTPTFSLGTSAPSAIRMAGAYGTFATSGEQSEPYSVTKVERKGVVKYEHKKVSKPAFDKPVADNVTNMLETVVQKGTGTTAKALGRPAAGKTGTTDDNKSAWFTGYTPQLSTSIGMWRVNDKAKTQKFLKMYGVGGQDSIHGASFPAEIWTEYMKEALKGSPVKKFPVPDPIGDKIYGDGASPDPTPSKTSAPPSPSDEPSESPSDDPSESPSDSPSSSSTSCPPMDPTCDENQNGNGNGNGGNDGGADGGGPGGGPGGDSGSTGDTGSSDGGLFGAPQGYRRE
ncbi:penicillin-binding protein [Streptomyces oryzae]|uniref:Penicillin-binding protein n=1 Tax=Streptomyces oryzae TaxID=1434886 RepID=A0ABS3XEW3_9ACTN|nr:transglycosylase domain-containing protein [Streptomyces oryzae]MBO8193883.1 penicillin-binding protein [Streptomyces oryzae]